MHESADPGAPISYQLLAEGTPVYGRDGHWVGTVKEVLAVEEEDVFDGIVVDTERGTRFIDGPDVTQIREHRVDLQLTLADVSSQPEHESGVPIYEPRRESSGLQDLWRRITLRRLWRRDR